MLTTQMWCLQERLAAMPGRLTRSLHESRGNKKESVTVFSMCCDEG